MKRGKKAVSTTEVIGSDQVFADVIRAVLANMRANNSVMVGLTVDLGELFPQDITAGHSLKIRFELCR